MKIELGSTGFLLTLVFIVLKATGVVHWSWLWVLSPMFITLGITLLMLAFALTLTVMAAILTNGRITINRRS